MSVTNIETGIPLKEFLSRTTLTSLLSRRAVAKTVQLPPELDRIVRDVEAMPEVDMDRGLRMLVDHDLWPESMREHPEEIPRAYSDKIADVALRVVSREPEALTSQAIGALGRAADDTGDHDLLELTLEKATAVPRGIQIDPNAEALKYAVEHDAPFRESLQIIRGNKQRRSLDLLAQPHNPSGAANMPNQVELSATEEQKQEYEFLYSADVPNPLNRHRDYPKQIPK